MTILSNNSRLLGLSRYGVMKGTRYAVGMSLAPEGMFKGYSIVVSWFPLELTWLDARNSNQSRTTAKVLLNPQLSKEGRETVFGALLQALDTEDGQNLGLPCALYANFCWMKNNGFAFDWIFEPIAQDIIDEALRAGEETKAA
jgi:hypothetical protein